MQPPKGVMLYMEVVSMTLGERIHENRKRAALSQEKLSELVGISRQAVTKWEADQSVPCMEHLIKLSEIFKIPLDELANGNIAESEEENKQPISDKRDPTILMANLTLLATIFIGASSNGLYQSRFLANETPVFVWIILALIGGIFLMIRDRLYYKKYNKQLIGYDLLFVLPVIIIPMIPMPYGISLMIMIAYAVIFMMIFVHKKIRPWKWRKSK